MLSWNDTLVITLAALVAIVLGASPALAQTSTAATTATAATAAVPLSPAGSTSPPGTARPPRLTSGEVTEIDGRPLESLIDYLAITAIITLTGCPALSLPYWPKGDPLPIGIQLIAAPGRDHDLLAFASVLERQEGFGFRPPAAFRENFP